MPEQTYEVMNKKVGEEQDMLCSKCGKVRKHIFCKSSTFFSSQWYWQCTGGHKIQVYKYP